MQFFFPQQFQFYDSTIKSDYVEDELTAAISFNSTTVRLKDLCGILRRFRRIVSILRQYD